MSFIDRLTERTTGTRRVSQWRDKDILQISAGATGNIRPYTTDSNEEYEMTLTVGVRFWANKAQYSEARRTAERHLAQTLYGDAIAIVARLRSAISDGDRDEAMAACAALERAMTADREPGVP